ncbi:transcription factor-like protein [Rhynchospora pubera]|uniref:Transcription factor-like protein n=1 Tax=Rhynchospora pubera TaxID=906938 RepID=A0AAV8HLU3_9POAL|nr:transcription factor-like protein [Rhynchospora pubera]
MPDRTTPFPTPTTTPMENQAPALHRNGISRNSERFNSQREQFTKFFECFLSEQSHDLSALRDAATAVDPPNESNLRQLVSRVVAHYERYYETKEATAQRDINPMFSPTWTSTTENIFMWVGGWRPSAAFHLLHSKSGIQLEARLQEIIRGGVVKDLGDVSAAQMQALDRLQRETVTAERMISEEAAEAQEAVAAAEMVQLVSSEDRSEMESKMAGKKERMRTVLARADRLRLDTMKGIIEKLEPIQAVHFLIAAAELHLAVHHYGKEKDRLVAAGAM